MGQFVKQIVCVNGLVQNTPLAAQVDSPDMVPTGVAAGTYGDASHAVAITVDTAGRVTAVSVNPMSGGASVTSFNTRTGAVTLSSADVTGALGFTPGTGNGNVLTGAANVFTVGPQTVNIDLDTHKGFVAKGHSLTQSANFFEAQNNAGTVIAGIAPATNSADEASIFAGVTTPAYAFHFNSTKTDAAVAYISGVYGAVLNSTQTDAGHYVFFVGSGGNYLGNNLFQLFRVNADGSTLITPRSASAVPLTITGAASATANLLELHGLSSTSTDRLLAAINATFVVSTDASRTGRLTLSATDFAATREGLRVEANGSAAALGFFGAPAVTKPTVSGNQGDGTALASLLSDLASLGLVTDSSSAAVAGGNAYLDVLSLDKPPGTYNSAKTEGLSLAAGATATLLDVDGPGYVSSFLLAVACSQKAAFQDSLLKIYYDGEVSPTVSVPVSDFFASHYIGDAGPASWMSQYLGANSNYADSQVGFYCYFPIPFTSHVKITLTSAAASSAATLFSVLTYHSGVSNTWARTRKLRVANGRLTGQAPNTVVTLVNDQGGYRGRLLGCYQAVDSFGGAASFAYAEGNCKIYLDGSATASYESSGMEDYFMWPFYWQGTQAASNFGGAAGVGVMTSPWAGIPFRNGNAGAQGSEAYRLHIPDPVVFNSGLKITQQIGDTAEASYAGNVAFNYVVWYYTES